LQRLKQHRDDFISNLKLNKNDKVIVIPYASMECNLTMFNIRTVGVVGHFKDNQLACCLPQRTLQYSILYCHQKDNESSLNLSIREPVSNVSK